MQTACSAGCFDVFAFDPKVFVLKFGIFDTCFPYYSSFISAYDNVGPGKRRPHCFGAMRQEPAGGAGGRWSGSERAQNSFLTFPTFT